MVRGDGFNVGCDPNPATDEYFTAISVREVTTEMPEILHIVVVEMVISRVIYGDKRTNWPRHVPAKT